MIEIMAQHSRQQQQQQRQQPPPPQHQQQCQYPNNHHHQNDKLDKCQPSALAKSFAEYIPPATATNQQQQVLSTESETTSSRQADLQYHQSEQDGKRTLIKNQLNLIEQLQLENANLRNERDQLQLENEELKFQLQMISSSNILSQHGTAFNDQELDRFVDSESKLNGDHRHKQTSDGCLGTGSEYESATSVQQLVAASIDDEVSSSAQLDLLATPLRRPVSTAKHNDYDTQLRSANSEVHLSSGHFGSRDCREVDSNKRQSIDSTSDGTSAVSRALSNATKGAGVASETGSVSMTALDLKSLLGDQNKQSNVARNNLPPQDEDERQASLVVQQYGDTKRVLAAAVIIQRAFRKYQICKRFRTITEQLRHTCQSNNSSSHILLERNKHNNSNYSALDQSNESGSGGCNANSATTTNGIIDHQQDPPAANSSSTSGYSTSGESNKSTDLSYASSTSGCNFGSQSQSNGGDQQQQVAANNAATNARAAVWESLSYAASRLVSGMGGSLAATGVSLNRQNTDQTLSNDVCQDRTEKSIPLPVTNTEDIKLKTTPASPTDLAVASIDDANSQQMIQSNTASIKKQVPRVHKLTQDSRQSSISSSTKQDQVFAAALNFQQLESIRKRQYRVGLNIFNKNPEKGVSFLVAHSFIDYSSPYTKSSASYYQSNQLHFMDKQNFIQQQQQFALSKKFHNCQSCYEEENLKRNIAHFLLHRKGLAKEKIGQYLGNLQSQFNQDVLKYYLSELDFNGIVIDLALRKFLSTLRLPGEAQKIEKIVDCFAQRYVQCQQQQMHLINNISQQSHHNNSNKTGQSRQIMKLDDHSQPKAVNQKNNLILLPKDEIFIITFAIIMLNTDLHSPSLKSTSRMSASQFVNNLRGVFKSQGVDESDLVEIYERVKANQITTTPDHVSHVMKVQQSLTATNFQRKELPNLCVPHRRLVCFCRLFEVYDANKKERLGQHQREIFLFNDMLLVTKLARRVRANPTQQYTFRQSISLQGLYVQLFQSAHYTFGIRLCQRSNDETIIMFNARNELDQSRFVDDLSESIAEMDEMEMMKSHGIVERLKPIQALNHVHEDKN